MDRTEANGHTLCKPAGSIELARRTLIATLEPRYAPRHISALPPPPQGYSPIRLNSSDIMYEGGNRLCSSHIFLSIIENLFRWCAHRGEPSHKPSREPSFTLAGCYPLGRFALTCSKISIASIACSIGRSSSDSRPPLEDSTCLRDSKEHLRPRGVAEIAVGSEVEQV